jgi:hypothetical protein
MPMTGKPRRQTPRSARSAAPHRRAHFHQRTVPVDAGMRAARTMKIAPPLGTANGGNFRPRRLRPGSAESPRRGVARRNGPRHSGVKDFLKSIFAGHWPDHQARGWEKIHNALRPGGRGENLWRTHDPFPRHPPPAAEKWNVKRFLHTAAAPAEPGTASRQPVTKSASHPPGNLQ